MKKWFAIATLLFYTAVKAQNEFASTAFYNEFKKIVADARKGFVLNKGAKKPAEYEELAEEFKVKLNLVLTDSGKIVVSKNGAAPFALYYFEPAKSRLKTDQRSVDIREAIFTAYALPLYTMNETKVINEKVYSDTYFYENAEMKDKKTALFRLSVYPRDNKYYLSLEIRGKNP